MNRFLFWQKWFFSITLIIIIYGLGLAFFNQTVIFNYLLNNQVNAAFWGTTKVTEEVLKFQRFIYGVLGATAAGWGIILAFIAHYPFRKKEKWVWNSLVLGICIWFVTDTGFSIYYEAYSNALINTILLIAVGLPLILTKDEFKK